MRNKLFNMSFLVELLVVIFWIAAGVTLFSACDPEECYTERPTTQKTEVQLPREKRAKLSRIRTSGTSTMMSIYELEYEDQRYIILHNGEGLAIAPIVEKKVEPVLEEPAIEEAEEAKPDEGFHWDY